MSARTLTDFLVQKQYNINSDTLHKIYELVVLAEPIIGNSALDLILKSICKYLKQQKNIPNTPYHEQRRIFFVADEIHIRLKQAIAINETEQIKLFFDDKLTLYNLGRSNIEHSIISFDICISCDTKLDYNNLSKKYTCSKCGCEYQS